MRKSRLGEAEQGEEQNQENGGLPEGVSFNLLPSPHRQPETWKLAQAVRGGGETGRDYIRIPRKIC